MRTRRSGSTHRIPPGDDASDGRVRRAVSIGDHREPRSRRATVSPANTMLPSSMLDAVWHLGGSRRRGKCLEGSQQRGPRSRARRWRGSPAGSCSVSDWRLGGLRHGGRPARSSMRGDPAERRRRCADLDRQSRDVGPGRPCESSRRAREGSAAPIEPEDLHASTPAVSQTGWFGTPSNNGSVGPMVCMCNTLVARCGAKTER